MPSEKILSSFSIYWGITVKLHHTFAIAAACFLTFQSGANAGIISDTFIGSLNSSGRSTGVQTFDSSTGAFTAALSGGPSDLFLSNNTGQAEVFGTGTGSLSFIGGGNFRGIFGFYDASNLVAGTYTIQLDTTNVDAGQAGAASAGPGGLAQLYDVTGVTTTGGNVDFDIHGSTSLVTAPVASTPLTGIAAGNGAGVSLLGGTQFGTGGSESFTFTLADNGTTGDFIGLLVARNAGLGSGNFALGEFKIDLVPVESIPEPSSLAVFGLVGGLLTIRRRR